MPRFMSKGPRPLCMSYVTKAFVLVSSSVGSKQVPCFVHGQGQKREEKHTTKSFAAFQNHSPLLTLQNPCELQFNNSMLEAICSVSAHQPRQPLKLVALRAKIMFSAPQNMNKNALTYGLTSFVIGGTAIWSSLMQKSTTTLQFHRQLELLR